MGNEYSEGRVWQLSIAGRTPGGSDEYSFRFEVRDGEADARVIIPVSHTSHFDDYGTVTYPGQASLLEAIGQREAIELSERYPGYYSYPSERSGALIDALRGALDAPRVSSLSASISGTFEGRHAFLMLLRPSWGAPAELRLVRNALSASLEAALGAKLRSLGAPGEPSLGPSLEPGLGVVSWPVPEPLVEPLRDALCALLGPSLERVSRESRPQAAGRRREVGPAACCLRPLAPRPARKPL